MLSGKAPDDLSTLKFPVYVSPKLDGIRCIVFDGVAYSRNMKPIPNKRVQALAKTWGNGWDGELISGFPTAPDVWNRTQSCVMKAKSNDKFCFHVFDWVGWDIGWKKRFDRVRQSLLKSGTSRTECYVAHSLAYSVEELMAYEDEWVRCGYEGLMIRSHLGPYKFGRSTTKEGYLLKLKRFEDAEATVVGVVEKMHNANEAKKDELGRTKRSSAKAGKVKTGTMGALECTMVDRTGKFDHRVRFEIGTGFTDEQRAQLWARRKELIRKGSAVKFKYQGLTPDGKPRFPVFLGFRDARDM